MAIDLEIRKRYGDFRLDVKFSGGDEIIALLGASGCGKSLTLRCIAGIEKPDRGKIIINGATLFDSERRINLSPQERRTGLLFQSYALFPNMTVQQNIQAGARREKNSAQRARLTESVIESFGLRRLVNRYPSQLSGGQQQRVALARILVSGPRILLLDEPFSAMDSHLRFQLEREVGEVLRGFGKTVILVSHDQEEVYRLADKIAVMNAGRIERLGTMGCIESNVGKTIALRMKTRGCSWSRAGAKAMAAVLCHLPQLEQHSFKVEEFRPTKKKYHSRTPASQKILSNATIHKASFPIVKIGKTSVPLYHLFRNIISPKELP